MSNYSRASYMSVAADYAKPITSHPRPSINRRLKALVIIYVTVAVGAFLTGLCM